MAASRRLSGTHLLFWTGLYFVFLSLNRLIVTVGNLAFPDGDLQFLRHRAWLAAVGTLFVGLIWDGE